VPSVISRATDRHTATRRASSRWQSVRQQRLAVAAVGSLIAAAFMGSVVVAPLYAIYQRKFGFSEITLTLIYAVYVVGNVIALLLFGQLSDQLGRKRVSLPTVLLAVISAAVFLAASGTGWLYAGRLLTGLTVGVLSGTGTAWLVELYGANRRDHATLAAAVSNLVGISIGPVLGGLLAQYAAYPLKLPFAAYIAILAAVAIAVWRTPEPRQRPLRALRDVQLHARIWVPREIRPGSRCPRSPAS
jgi:MFS family permease